MTNKTSISWYNLSFEYSDYYERNQQHIKIKHENKI